MKGVTAIQTMSNLPDDVRTGDIDRHFGEPETEQYAVDAEVGVEVEVPKNATAAEIEQAAIDALEDGVIDVIINVGHQERI